MTKTKKQVRPVIQVIRRFDYEEGVWKNVRKDKPRAKSA